MDQEKWTPLSLSLSSCIRLSGYVIESSAERCPSQLSVKRPTEKSVVVSTIDAEPSNPYPLRGAAASSAGLVSRLRLAHEVGGVVKRGDLGGGGLC